MKNKYVTIEGLAFTEQSDMNKLSNYAKQGWLLDSIKGCLFYKLKKGEPQDIVYSIDYQGEADEEYFSLFKEAGWNHVLSTIESIHIFSAPRGTEPIYSDAESERSKYVPMMENRKKGSIIFGIISLTLAAMTVVSGLCIKKLCLLFTILLIISLCIFIFNFMPYIVFKDRVKHIEKYGKCTDNDTETWRIYLVNLVLGTGLLIFAIAEYIIGKRVSVILVSMFIISFINISMGLKCFSKKVKCKKNKETL